MRTIKLSHTSGDDVIFTVGKGKITVINGADKNITYVDANGMKTYSGDGEEIKIDGKTVILMENYLEDSFNLADYDKMQTVDASAVQLPIEITGNKLINKIIGGPDDDIIDGDAGADTILGGTGNDTLVGGKGNDTLEGGKDNDKLTGGAGADVFVYSKGDGNDTITDYAEDDKISIKSDTVSRISTSKKDIVLTLASKGKITITGGADKVISYVDKNGDHTYPETVKFNAKGTAATLTSAYSKDSFNIADYDDYKNSVVTIDASAMYQNIIITANKKNNNVIGGAGNDTLEGGKGNDTLTGGKGSDVFIYNDGDGDDVIADFTNEDKIVVASGNISKVSAKSSDVILKIGKGKITVKDVADKSFPIYDTSDNILTNYAPASNFIEDDKEILTVNNNSLSAIVKDKSYASFGSTDTTLNLTTDKNFVPVITQARKK